MQFYSTNLFIGGITIACMAFNVLITTPSLVNAAHDIVGKGSKASVEKRSKASNSSSSRHVRRLTRSPTTSPTSNSSGGPTSSPSSSPSADPTASPSRSPSSFHSKSSTSKHDKKQRKLVETATTTKAIQSHKAHHSTTTTSMEERSSEFGRYRKHEKMEKKEKKEKQSSPTTTTTKSTKSTKLTKNDAHEYYWKLLTSKSMEDENTCEGMNPQFPTVDCVGEDGTVNVSEQAGQNVTKGYQGDLVSNIVPLTQSYFEAGLCPVNVHWHAGAEHYSAGEYDCSDPTHCGPYTDHNEDTNNEHRTLAGTAGSPVRVGFQCNYYNNEDPKFTTPYDWQFCHPSMEVGQTYEVHWPHSSAGACGTPNQYQTPFQDGVFCHMPLEKFDTLSPQTIASNVGVQAQTFTVVNDEQYYYGNLFGGMIMEGEFGADMAIYTGSTTGTSVDNETCSPYTPITWQVDRKCHLISASSFDKMCAEMMSQRDDMTEDLSAHGARALVADLMAANNQQRKKKRNLVRRKQPQQSVIPDTEPQLEKLH